MILDLFHNMGTPGVICTVAAVALLGYCIVKGGTKDKGGSGSGSAGGNSTSAGS